MHLRRQAAFALCLSIACWTSTLIADEGGSPPSAEKPEAETSPRLSELDPRITEDLRSGRPLVSEVVIPLCASEQVNCGDKYAGQPGSLKSNLYWNAAYGAKRFFDNPKYGWTLLHAEEGAAPLLATRVYRKFVSGNAWGLTGEIEHLVVLRAYHGNNINDALRAFYLKAIEGSSATFTDGEKNRTVRVHTVGYAGHNRMMDGVKLPNIEANERDKPLPAFVLACISQKYFEPSMKRDGVPEIVMTRTYMAPEAYVIDATLRGSAANLPRDAIRAEVVRTYAKWQRIKESLASVTFAELD